MRRHVMTTDLTLISVWWYQSWNRKELTLKILKGLLEHRGEENCIMRSFMICIVLQVILQQCHAGLQEGRGLTHATCEGWLFWQ